MVSKEERENRGEGTRTTKCIFAEVKLINVSEEDMLKERRSTTKWERGRGGFFLYIYLMTK